MKNLIENIKIYRIEESDRYIAISRKDGAILNINYMQGCHEDELKCFKENYLKQDKELTKYCLNKLDYTEAKTEIEAIDNLIWEYVKLEQIKCDTIEKIQEQINEIVQENCKSGDITPQQTIELETLTEKLSETVTQIVIQNL